MTQLKAAATEKAPTMVLDIFVTLPSPVLPSVSYAPPIL